MLKREKSVLLRIYISELDKFDGVPLYEKIVSEAMQAGLDGATILRGVESFGSTRKLHSAKVLRLAEALPIVIDIVDTKERIDSFIETAGELIEKSGGGGLATLEPIESIRWPKSRS